MCTQLSFRATNELIEQTLSSADLVGLDISEYVFEAVREKNERVMTDRLAVLSHKLSLKHQAFNELIDGSVVDGIA